jgi:hypothetical protein
MGVLASLGFLIPFMVGHPQILVGILVNAFLIRCALTLPSNRVWPVVFSPVLGVLVRGILFGPLTLYVLFMAPFIWAGNLAIIYGFKNGLMRGLNYGVTLLLSAALKSALIFAPAYVLASFGLIPEILLMPLGVMQFATAISGGTIVYGLFRAHQAVG